MNINISKNLFNAYCGLIVNGYNMMDTTDEFVFKITSTIAQFDFDSSVYEYFSYAKTNTTPINPYYPRGSDLSVACFFLASSI